MSKIISHNTFTVTCDQELVLSIVIFSVIIKVGQGTILYDWPSDL